MLARIYIAIIWFCFISLLAIGLMMVASTSAYAELAQATDTFNPYFQKQCFLAIAGLIGAVILSRIDYRLLKSFIVPIWIFCVFILVLCYVPGIGKEINGESRWIGFGSFTFQPSEIAKIGIMVCVASWYSNHQEKCHKIHEGFIIPGIIFGIPVLLILCEKDMGTAAALSLSGFCLMLAGGSRWWLLIIASAGAAFVLYYFVTGSENRMTRFDAWHDIEGTKLGAGRQQWLSTVAFARGGLTGAGLGGGVGKIGSIPEAHTDFIFATLGEELGLIGTATVVLLFATLAWAGLALALRIQDIFGRLLIVAFSCVIVWPAMLNMMVVSTVLPNTGLPLPFISYGGTNLFFTILAIGIMTSVHIHAPRQQIMYWPRKQSLNHIKRKP